METSRSSIMEASPSQLATSPKKGSKDTFFEVTFIELHLFSCFSICFTNVSLIFVLHPWRICHHHRTSEAQASAFGFWDATTAVAAARQITWAHPTPSAFALGVTLGKLIEAGRMLVNHG